MRTTLTLLALATFGLGGCIVVDNNPPPPQCLAPTVAGYNGTFPQYNVLPQAGVSIAGGDFGFLLTSNNQGGFRLVWTDTLNSAACFGGIIRSYGANFTTAVSPPVQTAGEQPIGAATDFNVNAAGEIRFASAPGSLKHGIDFIPVAQPVYFDLFVNGSSTNTKILYIASATGQTATANPPAAFASP